MSERMHFSQENVPYFIIEFDENTQTLKITKLSYVIWAPEHRNHTKSAKSGAAESRFLLPPKGYFFLSEYLSQQGRTLYVAKPT